ncbi:MAG: hypothetical protein RJA36_2978, partial [Pseudomonadota bacterium]
MDTITQIPIEQLHESTANPRRTYSGIDELAASIRAEGRIHEPLLVRPRITNVLRPDEHDGFELVFGHRRLRAAEEAGLATVPCMVRAMSDVEAASARAAENLQREDLHPIEEAEGFKALLDVGNLNADQLADKLGKSRSFVYGRLKLLQACPEVRKACAEGKIGSEVALLIARLRTDKLQAKALGYIRGKYIDMGDGGAKSFRQIRQLLNEHFALELKGALFDTTDAQLLPDVGPCTTCPKRAGNAPEYADIAAQKADGRTYANFDGDKAWLDRVRHGGADVCTDPDCFDAKKRAHLRNQAAALEAKGKTVVAGNAARAAVGADGTVKGAYIALKDVKAQLGKPLKHVTNAKGEHFKMPMPAVVLIQDPRTGKTVEAVKREDAKLAGAKVPEPAKKADSWAEQQQAQATRHARERAQVQAEREIRLQMLHQVRAAAAERERSALDLQLIARAAITGVDYEARELLEELWPGVLRDGGAKLLPTLDAGQLARLALDCALIKDLMPRWVSDINKLSPNLQAAAEHHGVDLAVLRKAAKGASTPSPAAQAAKKAAPAARGVRYRCPLTLSTWSGKGLQPAWLKAALASGKKLADFDVSKGKEVARPAG